ncbi:hypothetical protein CSC76_16655 [Pseudoxanthomonas mexicana]|uniref:hypothetical protein n=1 Tax=Pseudoxanthomonas mexicana TaxID=128785 RepID=UPI001389AEF9|nr:hypothetical protein [Pseudoxanthomonas mexicana]KAF1720999.1 hypothetical protein CSC76_16655 [Pseudoxanthomonas mexicana]
MNKCALASVPLLLLFAACASTPDVTLGYFHAKAVADVSVTRTFVCNKKKHVIEVITAEVQPRYVADTWHPLSIKTLDGSMADTSLTLGYYADGRLKTVNAEATGQGGEILKAVASAAGSLFSIHGIDGGGAAPHPVACNVIDQLGDKKPVAIVYKMQGLPLGDGTANIPVAPGSEASQTKLNSFVGSVCASVTSKKPAANTWPKIAEGDPSPKLELRQPGSADVVIHRNGCNGPALPAQTIVAPQHGQTFYLPIPRARAFGKQVFALELAESGVITKVQYAKDTGATQGLSVVNAVLPEFQGNTAAEKAKASNDRADEIAANARLAKCLADPTNCK